MGATKIRLPLLVLVLAAGVLAVAAGLMLFSTFMFYDDEGYVLFSMKNFATHGHLYGDVYSQYGPFPYVLYYLLHLLGMPLTHTAGRLLTLTAWTGSATLAAWMAWRATRSTALMLAVLTAVFVYLWIMISEPNHPGGLIALTTAIMAALGWRWLAAGQWARWAAVAGAGAAVLLLTKINIGVFAMSSGCALLLLHSRNDRVRRWAPWALAAGGAVLPLLLMRPLLGLEWVQTYAFVFALSAVAVVGAAARSAGPDFGGREWRAALLSGAAVLLVVLGIVLLRGTSLAELAQGIVLGPLRHPGHFSLAFHWPPGPCIVAIVSFGVFALGSIRSRRGDTTGIDTTVAVLRLVTAAGLVLMICRFPAISPDNMVFAFTAPCLWLFLWPLKGADPMSMRAQSWLGLLVLGQWLHVYPVPGSQIAWGTFLCFPLVAIGAYDAVGWLARERRVARVRATAIALQLGLLALAVVTGNRLGQIGLRYLHSRPLNLAGAESLRLPDGATALFRLLVFNAEAHSDMVFSLPGMFSLNLWSGLPAPTLTNVTHWFSLLDDTQQEAMIRALEAHPKSCVIIQVEHVKFLRDHHLSPAGPLYDYIMQHYEPAFEIDDFQFCVVRGRHIAPLLTAEMFQEKPAGAGAKTDAFDTLIKMYLLLPPDQQVGSIEIAQMDDPRTPLILQGTNARIDVTPVDLAGDAHRQSEDRAFPFALRGPALVSVYFDRGGRGFSSARTLIVVRNTAGAELALVRVRP